MKNVKTSVLKFAALLAAFAVVAGCSSSATDGGCKSDRDCMGVGKNSICNLQSKVCVDKGACASHEQCANFYPDMLVPYCDAASGLCRENGPCSGTCPIDGYVCQTDGSCKKPGGGDTDAEVNPDDDVEGESLPEYDEEIPTDCPNLTGTYDVNVNCDGLTGSALASISKVGSTCRVIIIIQQGNITINLSGVVDGAGNITTTTDKACSGKVEGGNLNLDCGGGCTFSGGKKGDSGAIYVDPSDVDFGSVNIGQTSEKNLNVSNVAQSDLTIYNIYLDPASDRDFSIDLGDATFPKVLKYGEGFNIKAKINSSREANKSGMIIFLSSSPEAQLGVTLKSNMKAGCSLEIIPQATDFGNAPVGAENAGFVNIKNTGLSECLLTGVSITDSADNAFEIDASSLPNMSPPSYFAISAGIVKAVTVKFHPLPGVHEPPMGQLEKALTGKIKAEYMDAQGTKTGSSEGDLNGLVVAKKPACLNVDPLDGFDNSMFPMLSCAQGCPGIRFGNTELFNRQPRQLVLSNCGDDDLIVTQIKAGPLPMTCMFPMPGFTCPPQFNFAPALPINNVTIPRGASYAVDITFAPSTEGETQSWSVEIFTNATTTVVPYILNAWTPQSGQPNGVWAQGYVAFGFSGTGAKRGVDVIPSKLDFGLITLGCCSRNETVTIYNTGALEIGITDVKISATSDPGFQIVNLPPLPVNLPQGGTLRFGARYCAGESVAEGPYYGVVEIATTLSNSSLITVPIQAEATKIAHQIDRFHQNEKPTVDILFVVDCSGSMGDEQENLAANFDTFINTAIAWNADVQLGITSCDMDGGCTGCGSGELKGDPKILRYGGANSMPLADVKSLFKSHIKLGTNCSGTEKGLEGGHLALSDELLSDPAKNAGFLRDNASLAIVNVSDEEDQSTSETAYYIDFLKNIKGPRNVEMLQYYAIVGDCPDGCSMGPDTGAAAGCRYVDVANNCNGFFRSICSSDWSDVYTDIGNRSFGLRTQFFLSREADPATIVVTVNGNRMKEGDDYVFDTDSNTIIFNTPPGPGSDIVVEYDALCRH